MQSGIVFIILKIYLELQCFIRRQNSKCETSFN